MKCQQNVKFEECELNQSSIMKSIYPEVNVEDLFSLLENIIVILHNDGYSYY